MMKGGGLGTFLTKMCVVIHDVQ